MSIYSGVGVAASIRQARQKQAVEEDERTELPLREQQLLASVRKEAGGLAAPRRVKPRPIDWRAAELPEEEGGRRRGERGAAAAELAKFAQAAADEAAAPREEVEFARGTVLLLKQRADVKTAEGRFPRGHVASLKQQLSVGGAVSFVEIVPDTLTAYVRFETAEAARKALSVRGLGELSLLRGEAERQYWMRAAKIEAEQEAARNAALARKKGAIKAGGKPKNAEKAPTGKPQSKGFAFRKGTVSF